MSVGLRPLSPLLPFPLSTQKLSCNVWGGNATTICNTPLVHTHLSFAQDWGRDFHQREKRQLLCVAVKDTFVAKFHVSLRGWKGTLKVSLSPHWQIHHQGTRGRTIPVNQWSCPAGARHNCTVTQDMHNQPWPWTVEKQMPSHLLRGVRGKDFPAEVCLNN